MENLEKPTETTLVKVNNDPYVVKFNNQYHLTQLIICPSFLWPLSHCSLISSPGALATPSKICFPLSSHFTKL